MSYLDEVRQLERTNDDRVWPARARIRWPKVPRHANPCRNVRIDFGCAGVESSDWVVGMVSCVCSCWRDRHKEEIPSQAKIDAWIEWSLGCRKNMLERGSHRVPGDEFMAMIS